MSKYDGMEGTQFYRWSIKEKVESDTRSHVMYRCVCECGQEKIVYAHMLVENKHRHSKSCGCYKKEEASKRFMKHGESQTKWSAYRTWANMLQRCTNPNNDEYFRYGGSGITVCDEWFSFEKFHEDMGDRPSKDHSVDRIDNQIGYSKENCKWSNRFEQAQNKKVSSKNTNGGYVGVSIEPSGKYLSRITANKKYIRLGLFNTIEEAFDARLEAELHYFGRVINKKP